MVAISLDPRRTLSPYYDELPTSPTSSSSSISGSSNGGDLVQRALRRAGLPQNSNTSTPSLLLFGASLILFLSSFSSYSSSSPPPVLGDLSLAGGSPPSLLPSKHYNSITSGRWIPPTFPRTKQDVIKIWGRPPGGSPGKGGAQRTLTVASWDWEPLEQIREWDSFEFVKRCFNSENGLLLVGGEYIRFAPLLCYRVNGRWRRERTHAHSRNRSLMLYRSMQTLYNFKLPSRSTVSYESRVRQSTTCASFFCCRRPALAPPAWAPSTFSLPCLSRIQTHA